ncbi:hypothetical protein HYH03_009575 [Edaphochlamys debaryana]|uniref:Anaphase-promoting complex subunit 4 WD40 domain-containing protein n=1 Tax=Edaphochlamys debaryana TaxID=47281 RepID=A0A835Y6U9_9CHLO|nr:hypothetical protein HYH03_009575 [Edaphochlamys debaryana]|eukprot:KAG2492079.1 hypothetical protein HYH03_009575 [Edaphochlamys debaryana]
MGCGASSQAAIAASNPLPVVPPSPPSVVDARVHGANSVGLLAGLSKPDGSGGAAIPPEPPPMLAEPELTPDGLIRDQGDPLATTRLGITLRGLRRLRDTLVQEYGAEAFASMTTADVNFGWVRRVTAEAKCRLLEQGSVVAAEDVAPPQYFISHAWKNRLGLLMSYVEDFLAAAADSVAVWIDILAVNQHEQMEQQRHDVGAFAAVVQACSAGTIVVLDIANCNPSTRGWCIFEWAHTLSAHGPDGLHLFLTPFDRATVFSTLDVAKAECQFPADKEMILSVVSEQHGSPEAFNHKLRLQLLLEPLSYSVDLRRLLERSKDTQWAFEPVQSWLAAGREGPRAFVVTSGAGEGKSTISAALAAGLGLGGGPSKAGGGGQAADGGAGSGDAAGREGSSQAGAGEGGGAEARGVDGAPQQVVVWALHFLKYNDARRLEPVRIIKTLAYQLVMKLPAVRDALLKLDAAAVARLSDPALACRMLLKEPLEALRAAVVKEAGQTGAQPTLPQVVILLDALDEADPLSSQLAAARPASAAGPQPSPAAGPSSTPRAYPTACSNPALQLLTNQLVPLRPDMVRFVLTTRPDAAEGEALPCLERAFASYKGMTRVRPGQLRRAGAGGGVAGQVEQTQQEGEEAGGRRREAGGVMVYRAVAAACLPDGASASASPTLADLYGLYGKIFEGAAVRHHGQDATQIADLLGVILAAQEPLSASILQQLGLAGALPGLPGHPTLFFLDEHHVYTLHKSLADWLANPATAGRFAPDLAAAHARIGASLAAQRHSPSPPQYVLKYLIHHLVMAARSAPETTPGSRPGSGLKTGRSGSGSGPKSADLLDEVLADFAFLQKVVAAGRGPRILEALGALTQPTRLSGDLLRWLANELSSLAADPASLLPSCLSSLPLTCRLHAQALAAAGPPLGVALSVPMQPPHSAWPAMVAKLQEKDAGFNSSAWSPDGRQLAVGGSGCGVCVYDVVTCQRRAQLRGHMGWVQALAWSPDGRQIMSGAQDEQVRWWDVVTGQCVVGLQAHSSYVIAVTWHPSGLKCASSATGGSICIYAVPAVATEVVRISGAGGGASGLAYGDGGKVLFAGCRDGSVRLYDASTNNGLAVIMGGIGGEVTGLAVSPDSRLLVGSAIGGAVTVLDRHRGWRPVATLRGHSVHALGACFSQDGSQVASCGDTYVLVHDVRHLYDSTPAPPPLPAAETPAAAHGKEPLVIVAYDGTARHPTDVKHVHVFADHNPKNREGDHWVHGVSWGPSGLVASCSNRGGVCVHDVALHERQAAALAAEAASAAPTGPRLCHPGGPSSPVGVPLAALQPVHGALGWAPAGRDQQRKDAMINALALSPDGALLASCATDDTARITCTSSWARLASLPCPGGPLALSWSPDGRFLACGGGDCRLRVFGWQAGADAGAGGGGGGDGGGGGGEWKEVKELQGHRNCFWLIPGDGPLLLAAACGDRVVRLYDAKDDWRQLETELDGFTAHTYAMASSPDGELLACGTSQGLVRLFGATNKAELWSHNAGSTINCLAWIQGHDERLLAAACDDGVLVLDVGSRQRLSSLRLHRAGVMAVAPSPDGRLLVSCSRDKTIRVAQLDETSSPSPAPAAGAGGAGAPGTGGGGGEAQGQAASSAVGSGAGPAAGAEAGASVGAGGPSAGGAVGSNAGGAEGSGGGGEAEPGGVKSLAWREAAVFARHESWVMACVYAPDGSAVYLAGHDERVTKLVPTAAALEPFAGLLVGRGGRR